VSPFAADSARKSGPKAEAPSDIAAFAGGGARATQSIPANTASVVMGSAAPALAELSPDFELQSGDSRDPEPSLMPPAHDEQPDTSEADALRDVVLSALANQPMLLSLLETAEWTLNGSSLVAKVAASAGMIEMSFTADARRVASAAASGQAGRPIKIQVEPGGSEQAAPPPPRPFNGSARSRAEKDPIVQRMKEKFGAEIRTVIDYREKG
jgi:hypothetical protein